MKVSELELGKFYKCALSGLRVLVFEAPEQIEKDEDGAETIVKPSFNAGKIYFTNANNQPEFKYIDIHDGQLEEL